MDATELSLGVTLAVLGAGLLHAGWNALLKAAPGGDPLLDTATVVAGSAIWGLLVIPFVGLPDSAAWKFAAASALIHWGYYITLAQAYRTGDLSFAYPLMRGTAPHCRRARDPFPARAARAARCRRHRTHLRRHRQHRLHSPRAPSAVGRGVGVRECRDHRRVHAGRRLRRSRIGHPAAYVAWLIFSRRCRSSPGSGSGGIAAFAYVRRGWQRRGLVGGAASLAAYGIVLWAMTRAPVAAVAALRETSVLFAALIGAVVAEGGIRIAAARRCGQRRRRRCGVEALTGSNYGGGPSDEPSHPARVVIVGGGIAGASTAYHLASRRRATSCCRAGQAHLRHDMARGGFGRADARDAECHADEPLRHRAVCGAENGRRDFRPDGRNAGA